MNPASARPPEQAPVPEEDELDASTRYSQEFADCAREGRPRQWIETLSRHWEGFKHLLERRGAAREFLRAVKEGNTTGVLDCLANNPFLLSHRTFSHDEDTVSCRLVGQSLSGGISREHLLHAESHRLPMLRPSHLAQVWHLLAEYGDASLLQALTNFCKIHSTNQGKRGRRRQETDDIIHGYVNALNRLHQTPLMFAAYHGRDEVIKFLLENVGKRK